MMKTTYFSPTANPMKIIGPSSPAGRLAATEHTTETALQKAVDNAVQLGIIIPFNVAFASAIPEPPLTGFNATGKNAMMASRQDNPTCSASPQNQ